MTRGGKRPGAGRPKIPANKRKIQGTIYLTPADWVQLDEWREPACDGGRHETRSEYIAYLIQWERAGGGEG